MRAEKALVGAKGIDSLPFSMGGSLPEAHNLKSAGVDFVVGYLGSINSSRVAHVIDSGMAFMPVTFADSYDTTLVKRELTTLALPQGVTVWLDLEGKKAYDTDPHMLAQKVNMWADAVVSLGYEAGIYVGSPQPFTSAELWSLKVTRYWRAPARVVDRHGALADPNGGWCMAQLWPSIMLGGVWVDVDYIQQDYRGRLPTWVVR